MITRERFCQNCGENITDTPRAYYCSYCIKSDPAIAKDIRREIDRGFRQRVLEKSAYKCFYCKIPLTIETIEVEHMTPVSRGGASIMENLVAACHSCNWLKGTRTAEEFLKEDYIISDNQMIRYLRTKDWRTWVYGGCKRPK